MSQSFVVFPMSQEMTLEAGKTYRGVINVVNPADADGDFSYTIVVTPYSVADVGYEANLEETSTWSQIVDWIMIDDPSGTLAPNETKEITFTVTVPTDAPAGGQYAAIAVRSSGAEVAQGDSLKIHNVYELASVIYATVEGETVHSGEVVTNTVPGFVTDGDVVLTTMVANTGNVHEMAAVKIEAKNILTGERFFPRSESEIVYEEVVMPSTTRYITRELNELPLLGVFEVSQEVSYLGEISLNTSLVILCPIWFMVLVVATIGTLIGTITALIMKRRREKRAMMI